MKLFGPLVMTIIFIAVLLPLNVYSQGKYAFLVGISNYPIHGDPEANWNPIHGGKDIEILKPILSKQGFIISAISNSSATAKSIRDHLKLLSKEVKSGSIVYIHFSVHGQVVEDLDGDESDGWDESIVPYDAQKKYRKCIYEGSSHIVDDELNLYIGSIRKAVGPTGFVYVVIDACHAGSTYRGEYVDSLYVRGSTSCFTRTGKIYSPKLDKRSHIEVDSEKGMSPLLMLEACRSYETNTEIKQDGTYCGSLSYYVSQVLSEYPLSKDTKWVSKVEEGINRDPRLIRQHLVIEQSK